MGAFRQCCNLYAVQYLFSIRVLKVLTSILVLRKGNRLEYSFKMSWAKNPLLTITLMSSNLAKSSHEFILAGGFLTRSLECTVNDSNYLVLFIE